MKAVQYIATQQPMYKASVDLGYIIYSINNKCINFSVE